MKKIRKTLATVLAMMMLFACVDTAWATTGADYTKLTAPEVNISTITLEGKDGDSEQTGLYVTSNDKKAHVVNVGDIDVHATNSDGTAVAQGINAGVYNQGTKVTINESGDISAEAGMAAENGYNNPDAMAITAITTDNAVLEINVVGSVSATASGDGATANAVGANALSGSTFSLTVGGDMTGDVFLNGQGESSGTKSRTSAEVEGSVTGNVALNGEEGGTSFLEVGEGLTGDVTITANTGAATLMVEGEEGLTGDVTITAEKNGAAALTVEGDVKGTETSTNEDLISVDVSGDGAAAVIADGNITVTRKAEDAGSVTAVDVNVSGTESAAVVETGDIETTAEGKTEAFGVYVKTNQGNSDVTVGNVTEIGRAHV